MNYGYNFFDKRGFEILMPQDSESAKTKVSDLLKNKGIQKIELKTENGKQPVSINDFKENVGL